MRVLHAHGSWAPASLPPPSALWGHFLGLHPSPWDPGAPFLALGYMVGVWVFLP